MTFLRPFRLGIIGSGPAGFYAAARIIQKNRDAIVDLYEQLPTPFGLVRYGVAPDHPDVKNCQARFEEVAESPRFNFIGNVAVGTDVTLHSMKHHYDALLFAYGASKDKTLGIPGEELKGIYSARAFVGWYNGLPEYSGLNPSLESSEKAVIIGNGNVALDIARILLSNVEMLRKTDISEHAVEVLSKSAVRSVDVVGRRGPMQATFTIKEVRELMNLHNVGFQLQQPYLIPGPDWISKLPRLEQRRYRVAGVLTKGSPFPWNNTEKRWSLESLMAPTAFNVVPESTSEMLHSIDFNITKFTNPQECFAPTASVTATGGSMRVRSSLAFRSIGYKSTELPGLGSALGVLFDDRKGIMANDNRGRALKLAVDSDEGDLKYAPGCYCAGWVKSGPNGVIASTMEDAFETADMILKDWDDNAPFLNGDKTNSRNIANGWDGIVREKDMEKTIARPVSWSDWKVIDAAERARGKQKGKEREKFRSTEEMLRLLDPPGPHHVNQQ